MKGNSRHPFLIALGTLLMAMPTMAATPPVADATRPLQFTSGGHVVGFTSKAVVVATGSHALSVEFLGAQGVEPVAAGSEGSNSTAPSSKTSPLTRVTYPGIWSGITLAFDAPSGLLRSTYTVAPGADPAQIRLRYNAPLAVEPGGGLRIAFATGAMSESAPVAWQEKDGRRIPVSVAFRKESEREVGFTLGTYDRERPLTIDPTLTWNTFLGGILTDVGGGIAVDPGGIYVSGDTDASDLAGTWGEPILPFRYNSGAFAAKLDGTGELLWNTFLGNEDALTGTSDIAVDGSGNVYVIGWSLGSWGDPKRGFVGGIYDAFVAKLDTHGTLLWNTFLGGQQRDLAYDIAVDASGNVFVTGSSEEGWGVAPRRSFAGGSSDCFVAKVDTDGAFLWNTFLGVGGTAPAGADHCHGIAVDVTGNTYVTGESAGTWGAPLQPFAGGSDAFVAKLDGDGALTWNTFFGGSYGSGIAVDASGNLYVTGGSSGAWGDPIQPFSAVYSENAFAAKLGADGHLMWNTFLGVYCTWYGAGPGIAVDASGNVYIESSCGFSWDDPIVPEQGIRAVLVAKLDTNGILQWHDFFGGPGGGDDSHDIAVDGIGNVLVVGYGERTWGAPIRPMAGSGDAFVMKIMDTQPVAAEQTLNAAEDNSVAVTLSSTDADGDPPTYTVVTGPAHGTLSGTVPDLTYEPVADYHGPDSFTFKANDGIADSNTATVSITVTPVNDAPGFTKGADQPVPEFAGTRTVAGWATGISAGPANEAGQTLDFIVSNDNSGLFAAQPAVDASGGLTYAPATHASGSALVTVRLHDDGGTADGGQDTSAAQSFTITIVANEVNITANDATATEAGRTTGQFTVTRSGATSSALTVNFDVTGTATSGSDYAGFGTSVTIPAGAASAKITVTPINDTLDEHDETVTLALIADPDYAVGGTSTATVTIVDDDPAPAVRFRRSYSAGAESTTPAAIDVILSAPSGKTVTVQYATVNGTAIADGDYTRSTGTLSFDPGVTRQRVSVTIAGDTTVEPDETFAVKLAAPVNATLGTIRRHVRTIVNDDFRGSIRLSSTMFLASEADGTVTITATRTGGSSGIIGASYSTANGTAIAGEDYASATGLLSWAAGDAASKTFSVPLTNDDYHERDETFVVRLSTPTGGATLAVPRSATVRITNDDPLRTTVNAALGAIDAHTYTIEE